MFGEFFINIFLIFILWYYGEEVGNGKGVMVISLIGIMFSESVGIVGIVGDEKDFFFSFFE